MIQDIAGITVAALMWGACVGAGATILARVSLLRDMNGAERIGMSFALGFGVLGWFVFFLALAGLIRWPVLAALIAVGLLGLVALVRMPAPEARTAEPFDAMSWLLVAGLIFVLAGNFCEGLAPPADADSLAYHFALPKQFLAAGRLEFVPRAVDGAAPLLPQMTYLVALGLGGERAMTLWTMASGWMPALLLYGVCRGYVGRNWSLAAALAFLSTPAILYGAGSGQVEARMALMALAAAMAIGRALASRNSVPAGIAGMLAGFVVASKYTGLLFATAAALPLFAHRRAPKTILVYGVAAAIAGFQWYAWNYVHTGDPVFPLLFSALHLPDSDLWTHAQDSVFRSVFYQVENPLPRDPLWFFVYPFVATIAPPAAIESGRVGLGPLGLVLLPFALIGAWRNRARLATQPFATFAVVAFAYYGLWYVTGSSQRVRHLLIVYPLLVACFLVAATRWSGRNNTMAPVAVGVALTLLIQVAGTAVFAANYVRYVSTGESRNAFLARNVVTYNVVPWINAHLTQRDKILVLDRQLVYLIDVPVFYAHRVDEAVIDVGPHATDPLRLWDQLRRENVTHLLLPATENTDDDAFARSVRTLIARGCIRLLHSVETERFSSRTFSLHDRTEVRMNILALDRAACPL